MIGDHMKKVKNPLTVLERVKGHNIREKGAAPVDKPTREIKATKTWQQRNTKGNPAKPK